ncbi:MAG TPA: hypothetical protein VIP77_24620 [Jiangellaceae bacterium]
MKARDWGAMMIRSPDMKLGRIDRALAELAEARRRCRDPIRAWQLSDAIDAQLDLRLTIMGLVAARDSTSRSAMDDIPTT